MILKRISRAWLIVFMITQLSVSFDSITLTRVHIPEQTQIDKEKSSMNQRQFKRYAVKIGTVTGILVMMYATFKAGESFKDMNNHIKAVDHRLAGVEKEVQIKAPESVVKPDGIPSLSQSSKEYGLMTPVHMVFNGVKAVGSGVTSVAVDLGKCFTQGVPTFITSMILSSLWQSVISNMAEASKQESIVWYIENHTKLKSVLDDLKKSCIPYDIHSELLSFSQGNDKAGIQLKAFIKDMTELVKDHDNSGMQDAYFEHSCDVLKKNYEKKGDEIEQLQDYGAAHIAQKKRALANGLQDIQMFESEDMVRQNIVDACSMLVEQVQKIITFSMVHIDSRRTVLERGTVERGQKRVAQMIMITNKYVDAMESLLRMNLQDLESMSIANKGLFTCTYEFEKLFYEHVSALNRYCSLIS